MKVSKKTIRDLIERGDLPSILKVLRSIQREIAVKDELAEEYLQDANDLKNAYSDLKQEQDQITAACREIQKLLKEKRRESEFDEVVQQFGGLDQLPAHKETAKRLEELPAAIQAALEKLGD